MKVTETFFSVEVNDMQRALAFYANAFGADAKFTSPVWSSLFIAGVRVGLFQHAEHTPMRVGLHFVVDDLEAAHAAVESAGGRVVSRAVEVAPGVIVSDVVDTEGNTVSVRRA